MWSGMEMHKGSVSVAILYFTLARFVAWLGWSALSLFEAPDWVLKVLVVWDITSLLITTVLVWRAAARMIGGFGIVLRLGAVIIAASTALQIMDQAADALQDPPPVPDPPAIFPIAGTTIHIDGVVDFDTFETLKRTLAAYPKASQVTINSAGGRIPAARGLARLITEAGLDTHVDDVCASACTIVFIAGQDRTLGDTAKIGFHQYRLMSRVETIDATQEQDVDIARFLAKGVDLAFMIEAMAVAHEDMWFPSNAQLRDAGVTTK